MRQARLLTVVLAFSLASFAQAGSSSAAQQPADQTATPRTVDTQPDNRNDHGSWGWLGLLGLAGLAGLRPRKEIVAHREDVRRENNERRA